MENFIYLVLNIYFEARGESFEGKKAVGHVTLNRSLKRDKPVADIVTEPYQFSWTIGSEKGKSPPIKDVNALIDCAFAAKECIAERMDGINLDDADHYHRDDIKPYWVKDMRKITKIGRHIFYAE